MTIVASFLPGRSRGRRRSPRERPELARPFSLFFESIIVRKPSDGTGRLHQPPRALNLLAVGGQCVGPDRPLEKPMPLRASSRLALLTIALAALLPAAAGAQPATVREYRAAFRTYPYSDPDPIPHAGRIYPYFRFDGFTDQAEQKEWTVVELENAWIRVTVLPEVGGKIWSAVEKSTGKGFLYGNQVVKFRDVAMRGPWTSGGIEANYGIIGHTPNCATPVDYVTRQNPDGSASVVIGVLDLLTRTPWRLEVTVPADKAYFTTTSLWHNATPLEQPYYTWMNAGIKAAGNLEFVYPGTHYIGHGGEASPWPIDEKGRNLAFYEKNDFGPSKSYHVLGRDADFFAGYWHDEDFGMGRYSLRDEKVGKKIWIWGLSRQGMIWEKLLTDDDGQYVEVQSGRSFNQAAEESSKTPFKHRAFLPYGTDTWTEYWFPVKGTKGLVAASPLGGLNVKAREGGLDVLLSPLEAVDDTLEVLDGDRVVFSRPVSARPLETWTVFAPVSAPPERLRVRIGSRLEWTGDPKAGALSRPLESPGDFEWDSVYGLWLQGKELVRQRSYGPAREALEACLRKDPHYAPALADLAHLRYRSMDYQGAFDTARKALAIDTYDPFANYYYGLAAARLGRADDARDGLQVAAQSVELRGAAWTELAKLAVRAGDLARAALDAERSLDFNRRNLDALQLLALVHRLGGRQDAARAALDTLLGLDPLSPFGRFEKALAGGGDEAARAFAASVRNEMPHETFLELAAWYDDLGRRTEAARVLELAPQVAEVLYWRARLAGGPEAAALLQKADEASPALVFPFRPESAEVLRWAASRSSSWRPRYYLALVHWGAGNVEEARRLLDECGETPDYAPFYAGRALAFEESSREKSMADLDRAARLDPGQWRYGRMLAERQLRHGSPAAALETARRYAAQFPANYILGMLHAKALLANGRHRESADRLARLRVLPYEGATEGRRLHRETHLMLAVEAMRKGDAKGALREIDAARLWPENLGAGKPYPENVDERLEDFLSAQALAKRGDATSTEMLRRVDAFDGRERGAGTLVHALAMKQDGREADARKLLADWSAREPGSAVARWASRTFEGEVSPPPDAAGEDARVLAAWLSSGSSRGQRRLSP
jgi:tetratricopeptide (TPR) repeat protein